MTKHSIINALLALAIALLLGHFGPSLDEASTLLFVGQFMHSTDDEDLYIAYVERCLYWLIIGFCSFCTLVLVAFGLGYLAAYLHWI